MAPSKRSGVAAPGVLSAAIVIGAVLALGGCQTASDASGPDQPTAFLPTETEPTVPVTVPAVEAGSPCESAVAWSVDFEVSGGLMGIHRSLSLDSGGEAGAIDVRKRVEAASSLVPARIEQVAGLLRDLCPFEQSVRQAACADCLLYELTIQWGDEDVRLKASDVTLKEQGLESLVGELNALLGEVLSDGA